MTHPLPAGESLTVEFKSDRKRLPDGELVEAVVCLANAEGGELWLGAEDDGTAMGLHADHRNLVGLPAMGAARVSPPPSVRADAIALDRLPVDALTHAYASLTRGGDRRSDRYRFRRAKGDQTC